MITRGFGNGGWSPSCCGAPPPLHVYDHESEAAAWHPLPRPCLRDQPAGPVLVHIPIVAPFGDDPTNPAECTEPRIPTGGMIGRLNTGQDVRLRAQVNVREVV